MSKMGRGRDGSKPGRERKRGSERDRKRERKGERKQERLRKRYKEGEFLTLHDQSLPSNPK